MVTDFVLAPLARAVPLLCRVTRLGSAGASAGVYRLAIVGAVTCLLAGMASAQSPAAYTSWYLAEGATQSIFTEDILVGNPTTSPARLRVTFLPDGAAPRGPYFFDLAPTSRKTLRLGVGEANIPEIMGILGLSARIDSVCPAATPGCTPPPIVVERSMYWTGQYRTSACGDLTPAPILKLSGHNATGLQAPADTWYLGEGSTEIFETYVLVTNVGGTPANVEVDLLTRDRTRIALNPFSIQPGRRRTLAFTPSGISLVPNDLGWQAPPLARTSFSLVIKGTPGSQLVVERAMYDMCNSPQGQWRGGHASLGLTQAATRWEFAEGTTLTGGPGGNFDAFLLIGNPHETKAARARLTFLLETSDPVVCEVGVPASTRLSLWLNQEITLVGGQCQYWPSTQTPAGATFPLASKSFGIVVESIPVAATGEILPLLAERSMYWGPGGPEGRYTRWREGHNSPGLTTRATRWAFAEGMDGRDERPGRSRSVPFTSYFLVSNPNDTPLDLRFTFYDEGGGGVQWTTTVAPRRRFTLNPTAFRSATTPRQDTLLPLSNRRFSAFIESTNGLAFIAERAMYWGSTWDGGHLSPGTPWTGPIAPPARPPLAPAITSVLPAAGPIPGGTPVTITGAGFLGGATDFPGGGANTQISTTVRFGGVPLANVVFVDPQTITGTVPPGPSAGGPVDVVVEWTVTTTVDNTPSTTTVTATRPNGYVYENPPQVNAIGPLAGPTYGDTRVTLTGANFGTTATGLVVRFRGAVAPVVSVSNTEIVVRTPPNTAGTAGITVTRLGVTGPQYNGFTYEAALATDNILAFGDSITWGTSSYIEVIDVNGNSLRFVRPMRVQPYTSRLLLRLGTFYPTQFADLKILESGVPGECAAYNCTPYFTTAILRLPSGAPAMDGNAIRDPLPARPGLLDAPATDLVILLEGVNDINVPPSGPDYNVVEARLRDLVRIARAQGKLVIISTLLPSKPRETDGMIRVDPAGINAVNARIRTLAPEEGAVLVDLYAHFTARLDWTSLISPDGLHPTQAGYDFMGETFATAIKAHFEGVARPVP